VSSGGDLRRQRWGRHHHCGRRVARCDRLWLGSGHGCLLR
jgi:hypothetical protein